MEARRTLVGFDKQGDVLRLWRPRGPGTARARGRFIGGAVKHDGGPRKAAGGRAWRWTSQ